MKANKNLKIGACIVLGTMSLNSCMFNPIIWVLLVTLLGGLLSELILQKFSNKTLAIKEVFRQFLKKIMNLFIVGLGVGIDWIVPFLNISVFQECDTRSVFAVCAMVWIILNEWVNILGNIKTVIGEDKIPTFITSALKLIGTEVESQLDKNVQEEN